MLMFYYCIVSHVVNSHFCTSINPCLNQAIHVLLMHSFLLTLGIRIMGPLPN